MEKKFCSNCGSELQENARFCPKCGTPVSENVELQETIEEAPRTNRKSLYALLAVLGAIILVVCGAVYFSDSQERREERLAHEKFVADSLEKAKQDSLKLAAEQEAERIENEKIAKFREKFTFINILGLLKYPDNSSYAQKCGLSLIYKDSLREDGYEEGQYFTYYDIVFGYEVEKGNKKDEDMGYDIKASSNHSCYFEFISATDVVMNFYFKSESDADYLFEIAKDYGLIKYRSSYYIPKKKSIKGIKSVDEYDLDEDALFGLFSPNFSNDWYVVSFYPIFI